MKNGVNLICVLAWIILALGSKVEQVVSVVGVDMD